MSGSIDQNIYSYPGLDKVLKVGYNASMHRNNLLQKSVMKNFYYTFFLLTNKKEDLSTNFWAGPAVQ
jgi:hypothetical protein